MRFWGWTGRTSRKSETRNPKVDPSVRVRPHPGPFKNVRKRLWFKERDYLFATKDYASALEYVRQCYKFAEVFDLTRSVISHGEESLSLNRLDDEGRPSSFTDEVKVGVIKFDNGSRIIAFSASAQAMSVYGGDVGWMNSPSIAMHGCCGKRRRGV